MIHQISIGQNQPIQNTIFNNELVFIPNLHINHVYIYTYIETPLSIKWDNLAVFTVFETSVCIIKVVLSDIGG